MGLRDTGLRGGAALVLPHHWASTHRSSERGRRPPTSHTSHTTTPTHSWRPTRAAAAATAAAAGAARLGVGPAAGHRGGGAWAAGGRGKRVHKRGRQGAVARRATRATALAAARRRVRRRGRCRRVNAGTTESPRTRCRPVLRHRRQRRHGDDGWDTLTAHHGWRRVLGGRCYAGRPAGASHGSGGVQLLLSLVQLCDEVKPHTPPRPRCQPLLIAAARGCGCGNSGLRRGAVRPRFRAGDVALGAYPRPRRRMLGLDGGHTALGHALAPAPWQMAPRRELWRWCALWGSPCRRPTLQAIVARPSRHAAALDHRLTRWGATSKATASWISQRRP